MKQSFPEIAARLGAENLAEFQRCSYEALYQYHFGLGTWVRNNLLQTTSALFQCFQEAGVSQRDEMSSLLLRLFYLHLHGAIL